MKKNNKKIILIIFLTIILVCLVNMFVQNSTGISDDVFMNYKYIIDYSPLSVDEFSHSDKYYIDFKNKEVTYIWSKSWLEEDTVMSGNDKKIVDDAVNIKLMGLIKEINNDKENYKGFDYIETNEANKEKIYCFKQPYNELFTELNKIFE